MKPTFTFLFLFSTVGCFSQATDTLKSPPGNTSEFASFVTILDIANATKDGIYLNGYVVNISYEKAKKLDGKKIKVTGKVRIVKGIKNRFEQGREEDYRYIKSPKIKVLKN